MVDVKTAFACGDRGAPTGDNHHPQCLTTLRAMVAAGVLSPAEARLELSTVTVNERPKRSSASAWMLEIVRTWMKSMSREQLIRLSRLALEIAADDPFSHVIEFDDKLFTLEEISKRRGGSLTITVRPVLREEKST